MHRVLILGAGNIGSLVSGLLGGSGDYEVDLADRDPALPRAIVDTHGNKAIRPHTLDASDPAALRAHLAKHPADAVVSGLPYFCNEVVGKAVREANMHYFDLTEDVAVTECIRKIAAGATTAFAPQCGLAPGFISIAANELITHFDTVQEVRLRVGALPQHPNNALKYSLTWSTDGLINEYGNACQSIVHGEPTALMPLEGLEEIEIDGTLYEAFNTSGGLGSLAETYSEKVQRMNYKTIRYPGHCEHMRLLMNGLKLNDDRATLKRILENALPRTLQDVVIIYVAVTGFQEGELREENYVNKVYPQVIQKRLWSAIQVTTAAGVCSIVDLVLQAPQKHRGFVVQENFELRQVLANRFGKFFAYGGTNEASSRLIATGQAGHTRALSGGTAWPRF